MSNSSTISNVPVTTTTELPDYVDIEESNDTATVTLDHDIALGAQDSSDINIALAIDTSGSTSNDSGTDVDGDGTNETFLEAQVYAARELFQTYVDLGYDPSRVTITLVDYSTNASVIGVYNLDDIAQFNADLDDVLAEGPGGWTNYEAALDAINTSWTGQSVDSSASNNVVFLSDGSPLNVGGTPQPASQFTDDATALATDFGANISAIGIGTNATLANGLNEIDNTGGSIGSQDGAVQVTDISTLASVINTPPPIVDVDSITIQVTYEDPNNPGNTLIYTETVPVGDPRLVATPSGYALADGTVFTFSPAPPPTTTATIEVITSFNDGSDTISSGQVQVPALICFVRGTLIDTPNGAVPIEDLAGGDFVLTRDNGPQPIRWIGAVRLRGGMLVDKQRPIRIQAHALGTNVPTQDLFVSPQHRVLVRSAIAQRMFGTNEVLVAAKQLCLLAGIDVAHDVQEVEYFHILFDRHEVVTSNGAETESLHTGPEALKSVGKAAREEIFSLFPELRDRNHTQVSARPLASGRMGRRLAARHTQNHKALVS